MPNSNFSFSSSIELCKSYGIVETKKVCRVLFDLCWFRKQPIPISLHHCTNTWSMLFLFRETNIKRSNPCPEGSGFCVCNQLYGLFKSFRCWIHDVLAVQDGPSEDPGFQFLNQIKIFTGYPDTKAPIMDFIQRPWLKKSLDPGFCLGTKSNPKAATQDFKWRSRFQREHLGLFEKKKTKNKNNMPVELMKVNSKLNIPDALFEIMIST